MIQGLHAMCEIYLCCLTMSSKTLGFRKMVSEGGAKDSCIRTSALQSRSAPKVDVGDSIFKKTR